MIGSKCVQENGVDSLRGVVVGGFIVVSALVIQVTPRASQLLRVVRHGQSIRGNRHVVHLYMMMHDSFTNKVK